MSRGRGSSIIGLLVSFAFVVLGAVAIHYVLKTGEPSPEEEPVPDEEVVEEALAPKAFEDYTWGELAEIASLMEAAPSEGEARAIAVEYGLAGADGSPTTATHRLELDNGLAVDVRLVGLFHDTMASTGKRAALTFMASPIDMRSINPEPSSEGGWKSCALRSWLSNEGIGLFPDDLAEHIVAVEKHANVTGKADDTDAIAPVEDKLWLFSCGEVCGRITWLADEFDYLSGEADALLNAEGEQYEAFAQAGVDQHSDSSDYLIMYYQGRAVPWWYRTPYSFEYVEQDDDAFYQVTSTGYASAVNLADDTAGVVVGFCL